MIRDAEDRARFSLPLIRIELSLSGDDLIESRIRSPFAKQIMEICSLPNARSGSRQLVDDYLIEALFALSSLAAQCRIHFNRNSSDRLLKTSCLLTHTYIVAIPAPHAAL